MVLTHWINCYSRLCLSWIRRLAKISRLPIVTSQVILDSLKICHLGAPFLCSLAEGLVPLPSSIDAGCLGNRLCCFAGVFVGDIEVIAAKCFYHLGFCLCKKCFYLVLFNPNRFIFELLVNTSLQW